MAKHQVETAVVTGAGSGLGRAFVLDLAGRGVKVLASDLDEVGLAATLKEARALGAEVHGKRCDVTSLTEVEALREEALSLFSGIDCWVNNAGVAVAGEVGTVPMEDWRWVVEINTWGMVHGCRTVVPHMRERRRGVVINVSSAAGLLNAAAMGPYNVSKAAVVALSETLYGEVVPDGVGVTVLCPTFFQTNLMSSSRSTDPSASKLAAKLMQRATLSSADVARRAVDDALAGRLYSIPMLDGRLFWLFKRLAPQVYFDLMPVATRVIRAALQGKKRG